MAKCPHCKTEISTPVHHSSECPKCSKSLHTCIACAFYSKDAHYGCRESIDEPVWDKERPNFCDFFRLTDRSIDPADDEHAKKSREALSKLFDF